MIRESVLYTVEELEDVDKIKKYLSGKKFEFDGERIYDNGIYCGAIGYIGEGTPHARFSVSVFAPGDSKDRRLETALDDFVKE